VDGRRFAASALVEVPCKVPTSFFPFEGGERADTAAAASAREGAETSTARVSGEAFEALGRF
jgi:hypothetical protein